ncbi:MAG: ATP-binding cassette domain-containing protein [Spirochaetaceae bacterium]
MDPLLDIKDLCVKRDRITVLENLNFSVNFGDGVVINGINGSGKTTLLKTIAGLLPYSSGEINRNSTIGYVPQEENHTTFPVSVWEMTEIGTAGLKLTKEQRKNKINKALLDCNCDHLQQRSYYNLSGGEKRRVSLARCLAQGAELLLLDEPLTFLDSNSRKDFINVLDQIRTLYNITIIMVTHTDNSIINSSWKRFNIENKIINEVLTC